MEILTDHPWLGFHVVALFIVTIATVTDVRTGFIPNWLTFPVILLAPLVHGAVYGLSVGRMQLGFLPSLMGILVCGIVPVFMFFQTVPGADGEEEDDADGEAEDHDEDDGASDDDDDDEDEDEDDEMSAMGGGDVKLFAALGGLLGPWLGFMTEAYIFVFSAVLALVVGMARKGLGLFFRDILVSTTNLFRSKANRRPLEGGHTSVRLGPAFLAGTLCSLWVVDGALLLKYFG